VFFSVAESRRSRGRCWPTVTGFCRQQRHRRRRRVVIRLQRPGVATSLPEVVSHMWR